MKWEEALPRRGELMKLEDMEPTPNPLLSCLSPWAGGAKPGAFWWCVWCGSTRFERSLP